MGFLQYLEETTSIANDEVYLSNMSKSFADKAWFLKYLPKDINTIVDFGGGAGEFAEYCQKISNRQLKFIIIDNNESFLNIAKNKGFEGFTSLQELMDSRTFENKKTCLILSSVIHEIYSYRDQFYDDIGVFWTDIKKCQFKCIAIRDMSIDQSAYRDAPIKDILWVYQNVLKSDTLEFKGFKLKDITNSFEENWGSICDPEIKKVDVKRLVHFLIKYRYQENWDREVKEDYLPVTQDKLEYRLTGFLGYEFIHKESSKLEFYHKQWTKDFKLNIPDNGNHRKNFMKWLMTINTHIKWILDK